MIEAILIWLAVALLVVTEVLGFIARRFGFITISETARKSRAVRVLVAALFLIGFVWWLFFHTA